MTLNTSSMTGYQHSDDDDMSPLVKWKRQPVTHPQASATGAAAAQRRRAREEKNKSDILFTKMGISTTRFDIDDDDDDDDDGVGSRAETHIAPGNQTQESIDTTQENGENKEEENYIGGYPTVLRPKNDATINTAPGLSAQRQNSENIAPSLVEVELLHRQVSMLSASGERAEAERVALMAENERLQDQLRQALDERKMAEKDAQQARDDFNSVSKEMKRRDGVLREEIERLNADFSVTRHALEASDTAAKMVNDRAHHAVSGQQKAEEARLEAQNTAAEALRTVEQLRRQLHDSLATKSAQIGQIEVVEQEKQKNDQQAKEIGALKEQLKDAQRQAKIARTALAHHMQTHHPPLPPVPEEHEHDHQLGMDQSSTIGLVERKRHVSGGPADSNGNDNEDLESGTLPTRAERGVLTAWILRMGVTIPYVLQATHTVDDFMHAVRVYVHNNQQMAMIMTIFYLVVLHLFVVTGQFCSSGRGAAL